MNSTFFEIGGHVIECPAAGLEVQPSFERAVTTATVEVEMGGTSTGFIQRRGREATKPTVEEYGSVPGRVRRARLAFGIAGTMALADGPLPVGDAVGIAVLVGYGSYEIYKSSDILSRAIFS